jgi:NADH-quinone oxidoreductase subunit H
LATPRRRSPSWRGASQRSTGFRTASWGWALVSTVKVAAAFGILLLCVAFVTWLERRVAAWIQNRIGPNRVGPFGLFQPIADGIKNFMKEELIPGQADRTLFILAPAMAFFPSLLLFAVIPWASPLPLSFDFTLPVLGRFVHDGTVLMMVADLPVGFLFILAMSSLAVYGIVFAGWSSGNKYAFLGGLRSSAQMISYEIALGLSLISVLLVAGDVRLTTMVALQQEAVWFIFPLTVGFVLFAISALAENNRLPFDLPEAEGELVGGYHTEYSSMRFAIFFLAEYGALITMSALMATIFFGGWDIPLTSWDEGEPSILKTVLTLGSFMVKTFFFVFCYIWIRWTLPRFRFDQLMALGWKVLLPVALTYIMVMAVAVWALDVMGMQYGTPYAWALFAVNVVLLCALLWGLDSNRIVWGQHLQRERGA